MDDACYLCRRTQVDLDRLNEEVRTRVYLSYFSNVRGQLDDQRRKVTFLQRLKDEESGDPHFRIGAKQVFGDPKAYEKLMPWIDTLIEVARGAGRAPPEQQTIGELVEALLAEERKAAVRMEQGLDRVRSGFATGGHSPFSLETLPRAFPVEWSVDPALFSWRSAQPSDREPLKNDPSGAGRTVDYAVHLCSVCRAILGIR